MAEGTWRFTLNRKLEQGGGVTISGYETLTSLLICTTGNLVIRRTSLHLSSNPKP